MGTENNYLKKKIKTEQEIDSAILKIANILNQKYKNKTVVFLIIMKGGIYLGLDLARKCKFDVIFDFVFANSYYLNKKLNKPKINYKKTIELAKKDIIIIDDLIDSGDTTTKIVEKISKQEVNSIAIVALYSKKDYTFLPSIKKYLCFSEKPPGFLLGYGLDYDEKYRNLNYLGIIKSNDTKE
ncbi:MAG: hypoxanthine phosphoribosyltransferase [Candidatus Hepatoplasma scabrum]|nr:MAG: hypoxanthine phosphoribosyltransferase [Candidatus Hepatoplasma sp.]